MSTANPEILIVDDSATVRASLNKFLGDNYIKHTANDGEAGWQALQANENISLVFADMHMPVLNGMLLLQRIRQSDDERIANLPVVMITGVDDTRAAKRAAHTIGASGFLGKPFQKNDIQTIAASFTQLNTGMPELAGVSNRKQLTCLGNHQELVDFGNRAIVSNREDGSDTSIIYAEIAETAELRKYYNSQTINQIVGKIQQILTEVIRDKKQIYRVDEGKFAIVLPMTKCFKANIVATRLKQAAHSIKFDTGKDKFQLHLALGLTSTEACDNAEELRFEDYCVQAAIALQASLKTSKFNIIRYSETYEEQFEEQPENITMQQLDDDEIDPAMAEFGVFFTNIMMGEFDAIPESYLPMLIDPMQRFLEYASSQQQENQTVQQASNA